MESLWSGGSNTQPAGRDHRGDFLRLLGGPGLPQVFHTALTIVGNRERDVREVGERTPDRAEACLQSKPGRGRGLGWLMGLSSRRSYGEWTAGPVSTECDL